MDTKFERITFGRQLKSMLAVDFRRMFTMRLFYIMAGICLLVPILILVMTTLMDGSVSTNPQTGVETVIHGFDSVWQIIGSVDGASTGMDITAMCNINLLYFGIAVLVGLFVSEDFKSGYAKNLFTVRAKKNDYVMSKTVVSALAGVFLIIIFFVGTMLGGVFSGLSFALGSLNAGNIVMCILSKSLLVAVFVPIYLAVSVAAKQKTWLAIGGSCAVGMLLFAMIPMMTPLNATIMNVMLCLAGAILFCVLLGAISGIILKKRDIL